MKVRVTVTVDVDPEAWIAEYGVERAEVRADVARHVAATVDAHLGALGVLSEPGWVTGG